MLTKFSINNMLGSKVVQGELVPGKNNIDLNSLPRGSYVISFEGNNKQVTKLIK
jgi:hypothetical protein